MNELVRETCILCFWAMGWKVRRRVNELWTRSCVQVRGKVSTLLHRVLLLGKEAWGLL